MNNEPSFKIRKADNLYDLCFSGGHKGLFLTVCQHESPIMYWGGRSPSIRLFLANCISEVLPKMADSKKDTHLTDTKDNLKIEAHKEIYNSLKDGEKGLFSVFVDDNERGYSFFYKHGDPFSKGILKDTLEKFLHDVKSQPIF
tara:strand:+ start:13337 stop:13765 length:429 start_codon:yes stop_codon:yes gene_type:complete